MADQADQQKVPSDGQELPEGHLASVGMRVVLNGGKKVLDSATVPIEWRFSDEAIARCPVCLLFVEHNESEIADDYHYERIGRRYIRDVDVGTHFMQIFKPGRHRVTIMAFGENRKKHMASYLRMKGSEGYEDYVSISPPHADCIAYCVVEFVVPEELFAHEPETRWQRAVWWWSNLWFRTKPVDECAYRKRKWFVGIPQLVIIPTVGTLNALFVLFGSFFTLFFGYRPLPVLEEVGRAFLLLRNPFESYCRYRHLRYNTIVYRIWSQDKNGNIKRMPVTGIEVFSIFGLICAIAVLISCVTNIVLIVCLVLVCLIVLAIPVVFISRRFIEFLSKYGFFKNYMARREARIAKEREEEEKRIERIRAENAARYRQWLMENYGLDTLPEEVDIWHLPRPRGFWRKTAQIFYVGFWGAKAYVCRPFSK